MVISFCCITVSIFYGRNLGWYEVIVAGIGYGFFALDAVMPGPRKRAIILGIGALVVTALQALPAGSNQPAPEAPISTHVG